MTRPPRTNSAYQGRVIVSDFALVEALQQPEAFDHPVARFEVLQTHISWVLLTGSFAYKLKKPVDLGFVDFSTLEKRRFFCDEELRLNRRLAAELYVGVVAIVGSLEKPKVVDAATVGAEPVLEYAVKMQQFDQSQLATAAFARGELQPRHWDRLADALATFHGEAPAVDVAGRMGTQSVAADYMRRNFEELHALEFGEGFGEQVRQLRDWTEAQLARWSELFASRRQQGLVRECHGDLHLGNMVFLHDTLVPFDCIDFNEELRWLDVQSEIAFTVMDLEDRGQPEMAFRFLNRYLEATGDYGGLRLLPLFQTYRAMVRVKVASIRDHQGDVSSAEHARLVRECQDYVDLASRYAAVRSPRLVLMHGVSGSGKSTYSARLIERTGAVRVRSDVERKRLHGLRPSLAALPDGAAGELYSPAATDRTYARLLQLAQSIVAAGFTAIVDATFLREDQRRPFIDWAAEQAIACTIVECAADDDELRRRVRVRAARGEDPSDAGLDVLEQQLLQREPLTANEQALTVTLTGGAGKPGATAATGKDGSFGMLENDPAWQQLVNQLTGAGCR